MPVLTALKCVIVGHFSFANMTCNTWPHDSLTVIAFNFAFMGTLSAALCLESPPLIVYLYFGDFDRVLIDV